MMSSTVRVWFLRAWWVLVPAFAVLVIRLVYERGCAAPYELLPQLTTNALLAWPLASMYLAVHCWAVAAYLITVQATGTLLPSRAAAKSIWGSYWPMVLFTIAILALEYSPIPFWRWVGRSVAQCG